MFGIDDLVFVTFEQNGIVNQFHLAHYDVSGNIHTSCGMVLLKGSCEKPTLATVQKPDSLPCCSSCQTKVTMFSKKFFGGRKLGITKKVNRKKEIGLIGDEMAQATQSQQQEPEKRPAGTLF